jgi:predicted PurR-regulated permease PerM
MLAILVIARSLLYPLAIAVLLSYLVYPLARFLERARVPRIVANLICIIITLAVIISAIFLLYKQLSVFLEDLPALREQAYANIENIGRIVERRIGLPLDQQKAFMKITTNRLMSTGVWMQEAFSATFSTLVAVGLLPVYMFFLLYYRNKFESFLYQVVDEERHIKLNHVMMEISQVTKRYMSGIVIVVAILCVLNSVGLLIVGIRYAILFGVISAFMNFIPYFGTLIGGSIPFVMAILIQPSPKYAIGVLILFIIIQFIENNILTPNIVGGQLRINPFFTILSIIIGSMIWGLPGMIVAVPFVGMFKIVCDNVPRLKPYAYLLGDTGSEKHAITFEKIKKFFRRR